MARLGRIAFLGTGSFGVPLLSILPNSADELLVMSQPDRPAGRGLQSRESPVSAWARSQGLQLATPLRLRSDEGRGVLHRFAPDGILLAAYGQLVPADLLSVAPRPPLNVHPSLLPRHRGAAPVASTILAGDRVAGVTLMVMTPELDAGPIVRQWEVPLAGRETTPELEGRLAVLAADVMPPELETWAKGELVTRPQDRAAATMIRPFHRLDGWIDWKRSAEVIDRQVRALQPWPGAWTTLDGHPLQVFESKPLPARDPKGIAGKMGEVVAVEADGFTVVCADGRFKVTRVQPADGKKVDAGEWASSAKLATVFIF
ncbi:MAG: methionyl-tRNA formyltransferase [Chloroflexota bacterium]|nr:methionyl-tRNA formyltransferase [Chloroflexota bacterium]